MALNIKRPQNLEVELLDYANKTSPVIILDTGGLIDIVQSTRNFSLNGNGHVAKYPQYGRATAFLRHIGARIPVLITPKTNQEIQNHIGVRLNSHELEVSPALTEYSFDLMSNSVRFMGGVKGETSLDDTRYDAHWAALEGCKGNLKKKEEGCSDTDKEILIAAAYLSQCRHPGNNPNKINPVLVVSPDLHITEGAKLLRREFDGKYSTIIPISTRE